MKKLSSRFVALCAAGAALVMMSSSALAASTWSNFGQSCATSTTQPGTTVTTAATGNKNVYVGNALNCGTSDSVSVSAEGFSTTSGVSTAGTTFATAEVRNWGSGAGLGVINRYENPDSTGPHATDNQYGTDAIRLAFSKAVTLTSVGLGWVGSDTDFSVLAWTGSGTPGVVDTKTLSGTTTTASTLLTSGWTLVGNYGDVGVTKSNPVNISTTISSSYWLISAYNGSFGTASANGGSLAGTNNDYFKLMSVAANATTTTTGKTPEPGSLALVGLAMAGMLAVHRRRQQQQAGRQPPDAWRTGRPKTDS